MKDYASMSDFEINCRVHAEVMEISGLDSFKARDYCNNPADAWPIISENKISTMWMTSEKEWCAWSEGDLGEGAWYWENSPDYYFNCTSQLRAAMIVFLMMKESEK